MIQWMLAFLFQEIFNMAVTPESVNWAQQENITVTQLRQNITENHLVTTLGSVHWTTPGNNMTVSQIHQNTTGSSLVATCTLPQLATTLWKVGAPIIISMGTLFNILTIIVLLRKRMRSSSSSRYLIVLAVCDILALNVGLLRLYIREIMKVDIRNLSDAGCKIHIFLVYFFTHFSAWVLIFLAVERFIAVWFPFKAKVFCTPKKGTAALVAIGVSLLAINAHFFWTMGLISFPWGPNEEKHFCVIRITEYPIFHRYIWPWVDAALYSYIPFVVMIVCNSLIIAKLLLSRMNKKKTEGGSSRTRMKTMTAMLLSITFSFLILTTPMSIYISGYYLWWSKEIYKPCNHLIIFWPIANLLFYLNNAVNFLCYCVSGPSFRREIMRMCGCACVSNRVRSETVDTLDNSTKA